MASGPGGQPPALPIKQHRSRSSRCSSAESDCALLSPVCPQPMTFPDNDVFTEPIECHAAQCPIHQRYDPSQHLARFFSDGIPPPVPKKRLARTLSLPAAPSPPLSPLPPLSLLQRRPQNFDNPLYMLAPIQDTHIHEELEEFEAVRESPIPSPFLSQLSFDTPDEQLPLFFSSIDDQRVIFHGIQQRHLLFLRSMAQSIEAGILLQGVATEGDLRAPQDFLLSEGGESKQIKDTSYNSLHSTHVSEKVLNLKEHKQTPGASSQTKHQPPHANVQQIIANFQPADDNNVLQPADPSHPVTSDCTAAKPPGGDTTESPADPMNMNAPSTQSFLQKGKSLSIEKDLPRATLEDFVQDSRTKEKQECLDYDRQVCVLLLQILTGSLHQYNISGTAAELRPQEILLLWSNKEKKDGGNKGTSEMIEEERGNIQTLWRSHGSPRVVLSPLSAAIPVSAPLTYIKSQIRALIQYCLISHESQTSSGLVPARLKSSYCTGLLHVASLLQNEVREPKLSDMVTMLQVLLWGPHIPLLHPSGPVTTTIHNWLTIKRALLVMKFAERGLIQDQSALDWEDCLCLQYLSFTDPEVIVSVTGELWPILGLD